jgi:hypothetical protein
MRSNESDIDRQLRGAALPGPDIIIIGLASLPPEGFAEVEAAAE